MNQLTTNSTNYYQLTKYYVDKTKLLFLHTKELLFGTLHSTQVLYTFSLKLRLSYYQTTILKTEKDYLIIYKLKSTFESWQSVFFSSVLFFDEIFFQLTSTAWHGFPFRNYSTAVFAFSHSHSQFTSPSEWNVVTHRGNITDHLLTIRILLKFGEILPPCWSGTRSLYPARLWTFLRGARLPSIVSWFRALTCTWTGTGVAATRPPLPTRTHKYSNFMSSSVVAWEQDKGTHEEEVCPCRAQHLSQSSSPATNQSLLQFHSTATSWKMSTSHSFFQCWPFSRTVHGRLSPPTSQGKVVLVALTGVPCQPPWFSAPWACFSENSHWPPLSWSGPLCPRPSVA